MLAGTAFAVQAAGEPSVRVQVVDVNGLPVRDAVVELHSARGTAGPIRFPWKMGMAQKSLQFTPGTLVVAQGSTVAFPNLDQVRHSIYSFSKPAKFEIELYGRDQTRTQTFPITGSVKLGCNIHDQMRGYIRVTDTPFAGKTDGNGYVTLEGMPAGNATLTVWHPQLRAPGNESKSAFNVTGPAQGHKIKVALR
ncbi:MAG: methylamine utilization protein [Erythrobacter sp.]|nr:methylamine utilization protein [Erythrobacter sp.]